MAGNMKNTKYLSIPDICQRYGIGRSTFHRWAKNDQSFPSAVLISGRRYYSELDLMRWESARGGVDPDMPDRMHGLKPCSPVITEYDELVEALVKRRKSLGMSSIELDAKSGVQEGYISKLENYDRPQGRGVGKDSLPLWLGGLKCGIVLVDLPRRPRKKRDGSE